MVKKLISLLILTMCILSFFVSGVYADNYYYDNKWNTHNESVKLFLDNKQVFTDVPPIIVDGRTLVPVRAFFEKLGADVLWDQSSKKVTVKHGNYNVTLQINNFEANVNGNIIIMDVPAKIVTDSKGIARTVVPVRFISSQLGYSVSWDAKTYSVYLTKNASGGSTPGNTSSGTTQKAYITSFSSDANSVTIYTSEKSAPVVSKMANPSRFILDFYGFSLKNGDGKLNVGGNCYSNVRFANHPDYSRVVVDITKDYTYELKITNNACIVYLKGTDENNIPIETPDIPENNTEETQPPEINLPTDENAGGTGLVVIDPGHGGSDPGAVGYKNGEVHVKESDANLDISLKLYENLKAKGVNVSLTRSTDMYVSLADRTAFANNLNATLFICVHNNSATIESANGSMVYYFTGSGDAKTKSKYGINSKELAALIQKPLIEYGGRYDRKIADGSQLYVLRNTIMPAVLIECAFLSNNEERELLSTDEFKQKLADGIAVGVIEGLKQTGKY